MIKKDKIRRGISHNRAKEIGAGAMSLAILAAMFALILKPTTYMDAFSNGLLLFAANVLPALFPFFFLTKLAGHFGIDKKMGKLFSPLMRVFNAPDAGGYVFALSLLCGYPVGAKLIDNLYHENKIDRQGALSLCSFCSCSGPIFMMGTVGAAIFGSARFGLILLLGNYLSAFINGIIWRGNTTCTSFGDCTTAEFKLNDAAYDSIISVMLVGGYIALFNMLGELLFNIGITSKLAQLTDAACGGRLGELSNGIWFGLIEITRGCVMLSTNGATPLAAGFCSFIVGFGGLGIAIQSLTLLSACGISAKNYFSRKLTQSVIAGVIGYLFAIILL